MNAFNINVYILLPLLFVLAYLIIRFVQEYVRPGRKLAQELKLLAHRIRSIKSDESLSESAVGARELLEKTISDSPINSSLEHLWSEYTETLHAVRGDEGEIIDVRATMSSGEFFTKYSVIDLEIRADFFKHLPGILTGVGIIATFVGLIVGLGHYDTQDPDTLELLIREVFSAFVGSCTAIVAAICITYFEKKILRDCYANLNTFVRSIDTLFDEGVGEEYLSRMVLAAEKISADASALKDALIVDLGKLMHEVADKQIKAVTQSNQAISDSIGAAIKDNLREPMKDVMDVVRQASGQQGEAVSGLLENLLTAFMERLDNTFGQQIESINRQMQASSDTMNSVQQAMTSLIGDISSAGKQAANEMTVQLEEAMNKAATAQNQMNENLKSFVMDLKTLTQEQQAETTASVASMLQTLQEEFKQRQDEASRERETMAADGASRVKELSEGSKAVYAELTENVETLVNNISSVSLKTEENIRAIQNVSTNAIEGMGNSANLIGKSADQFKQAGDSIVEMFDSSRSLIEQISELSDGMTTGASSLREVVADHQTVRDQVGRLLQELKTVMSQFDVEVGDRSQVVSDMRELIEGIRSTSTASDKTLKDIVATLEQSFLTFGNAMATTVRDLSATADTHMMGTITTFGQAVGMLSEQIQEMSEEIRTIQDDNHQENN